MQVSFASGSSGQTAGNDFVCATAKVVVVVSGLPRPAGNGSRCSHGTSWFVRRLGTELVDLLESPTERLATDDLSQAIVNVSALHMFTCRLGHPDDPCAAVAVLREQPDSVEYLLVGSSRIILDEACGARLISDEGPSGGRSVSADPKIASRALTGSLPRRSLNRVVVASGGVEWGRLADLLDEHGPGAAVSRLRDAGKRDSHSDGTVVVCRFEQDL